MKVSASIESAKVKDEDKRKKTIPLNFLYNLSKSNIIKIISFVFQMVFINFP